eukprot:3357064-Amphidinium_carterae.1
MCLCDHIGRVHEDHKPVRPWWLILRAPPLRRCGKLLCKHTAEKHQNCATLCVALAIWPAAGTTNHGGTKSSRLRRALRVLCIANLHVAGYLWCGCSHAAPLLSTVAELATALSIEDCNLH